MRSYALRKASVGLIALVAIEEAAVAKQAEPQVRTQAPVFYRMILGVFEVTTVSDGRVPQAVDKLLTNATPEEVPSLFAREQIRTAETMAAPERREGRLEIRCRDFARVVGGVEWIRVVPPIVVP